VYKSYFNCSKNTIAHILERFTAPLCHLSNRQREIARSRIAWRRDALRTTNSRTAASTSSQHVARKARFPGRAPARELCDRGGPDQGYDQRFSSRRRTRSRYQRTRLPVRIAVQLCVQCPPASASGLTRPRNYACQPLAGGPVSNSGRQRLEAERLNDSRASIDLQQQNIYLYIELAH
jgi:hypothetical protein